MLLIYIRIYGCTEEEDMNPVLNTHNPTSTNMSKYGSLQSFVVEDI
jgi:hypothetical protein